MVVKKQINNKTKNDLNSKKVSCFDGIIKFIDKKYNETKRFWIQYELEKYLSDRDCKKCKGYRLNEKPLAVKIDNIHIGEITKKIYT